MKKDTLIVIKDHQKTLDGCDETEITTRGKIFYNDTDNFVISYDESLDEETTCHTTVRVKNNTAQISRRGGFSSDIYVTPQEYQQCQYNTPFGSFLLGIYGKEVRADFKDGNGTLKLAYSIDFAGDYSCENSLVITVTS